MTIGRMISEARKRKGFNQTKVADEIGMKLSTYAKKEVDGNFTETQLRQLAKFLQIKYSKLEAVLDSDKITIDDAVKMLLEKSLVNEAVLNALTHGVASFLAEQRGVGVEVVLSEMAQQATLVLARVKPNNS